MELTSVCKVSIGNGISNTTTGSLKGQGASQAQHLEFKFTHALSASESMRQG